MTLVKSVFCSFMHGLHIMPKRMCNKHDKKIRNNMSETQHDQMLDDSFPASDPPSTY